MEVVRHLDKKVWNAFLAQQPNASIYHTYEMFQVAARSQGQSPEFWAVIDEPTVLALLLPVKISLLTGWLRGFTTRAVSYGSVLCAPGEEGSLALELLLDAYQRNVGSEVLFTELRNQSDLSAYQPILNRKGFRYEDHLNFLIDLDVPEKVLWSKINKSGRHRIRTAEKRGVRVEEASNAAGMYTAYLKLKPVYKRIGVPLADISMFQSAYDILAPRGMLKIFLAYAEEECIGARILLTYRDRIIDWYAGADRDQGSYSPNETLVWHVLRWGQAHGFREFDFGGGGKPGEPYGPREFKLKFGGKQVNYGRNVCIHAHWRFSVSQAGYGFYRRLPRSRSRSESNRVSD
ncbi:MAG TPA: GNAT family N-acetyltransferase [Anaerolineae bacterium]|nr:GNAT family N-acetyltransferase [Anaerolineae bacterium]